MSNNFKDFSIWPGLGAYIVSETRWNASLNLSGIGVITDRGVIVSGLSCLAVVPVKDKGELDIVLKAEYVRDIEIDSMPYDSVDIYTTSSDLKIYCPHDLSIPFDYSIDHLTVDYDDDVIDSDLEIKEIDFKVLDCDEYNDVGISDWGVVIKTEFRTFVKHHSNTLFIFDGMDYGSMNELIPTESGVMFVQHDGYKLICFAPIIKRIN